MLRRGRPVLTTRPVAPVGNGRRPAAGRAPATGGAPEGPATRPPRAHPRGAVRPVRPPVGRPPATAGPPALRAPALRADRRTAVGPSGRVLGAAAPVRPPRPAGAGADPRGSGRWRQKAKTESPFSVEDMTHALEKACFQETRLPSHKPFTPTVIGS